MHEGVVETLDRRRQHSGPIRVTAAQQPQLFLLTNVRQIPDQRAHQRVVLAAQFVIVEIDQPQRARACPLQIAGKSFPGSHTPPCANCETVAAMPWSTTWSEKSSPGHRPCSTLSTSRRIASASSAGARSAAMATQLLADA